MSLNLDALAKLNPTRSEFFLSTIDKTIYLSPCTLGKILELHRKHGSIETLLSKDNLANVPKVAFDIMAPESRMHFKVKEIETTDDEGNLIVEKIGGFKLFEMSIAGLTELENILLAIIKSFGGSETREDVKKKDRTRGDVSNIDWEYILDLFASEYGWSTTKILNLTLVELFWRVKAIHKRHNKQFRERCVIAGRQLKPEYEEVEISKEVEDKISKDIRLMNKKAIEKRIWQTK